MDEKAPEEIVGPYAILLDENTKGASAAAEKAKAASVQDMHPVWRLLISREARLVLVVAGLASAIIPWYVQAAPGTDYYTLISAMTQSNIPGLELGGVVFFMGLAMVAFSSVWWNAAGDAFLFIGLLMGNGAIAAKNMPGATWVNGDGASIAWAVLLFSFVLLLVRLRMED